MRINVPERAIIVVYSKVSGYNLRSRSDNLLAMRLISFLSGRCVLAAPVAQTMTDCTQEAKAIVQLVGSKKTIAQVCVCVVQL